MPAGLDAHQALNPTGPALPWPACLPARLPAACLPACMPASTCDVWAGGHPHRGCLEVGCVQVEHQNVLPPPGVVQDLPQTGVAGGYGAGGAVGT